MKRRIALYSVVIFFLIFGAFFGHFSRPVHPSYQCKDCNVLFIHLDTLRASELRFEGYPKPTSPYLDFFSKECAAFSHAFSPYNITMQSDFSIFTSLYASSHHIADALQKNKLSAEILTLPQILKLYGYRNVWMAPMDDPNLPIKVGLGRGFEEFDNFVGVDDWDKAFAWFNRHSGRNKFFMFLHSYGIHPAVAIESLKDIKPFYPQPYHGNIPVTQEEQNQAFIKTIPKLYQISPELILEIFGAKNLSRYPELLQGRPTTRAVTLIENPGGELDFMQRFILSNVKWQLFTYTANMGNADDLAYLRALYDAKIREQDFRIGELLGLLQEKGLLKRTVVIITSEHGDSLFKHGVMGHGNTLFNSEIQVPLLIYLPGMRGKVISNVVGNIDIMPTVLDALGIPIPAQVQGMSLLPQIMGASNAPRQTYVFAESGNGFFGKKAVISEKWKLIETNGYLKKYLLFNLQNDPGETESVAESHPDVVERLRNVLRDWERKQWMQKSNPPWEKTPYLDEAAKERIQKSGYW